MIVKTTTAYSCKTFLYRKENSAKALQAQCACQSFGVHGPSVEESLLSDKVHIISIDSEYLNVICIIHKIICCRNILNIEIVNSYKVLKGVCFIAGSQLFMFLVKN